MKKIFKLLLFTIVSTSFMNAQTMTFSSGASEPGFTFNGWTGVGAIYLNNLSNPATITKDTGTWNVTSFTVGPFLGANVMQVTSNLGNSYTYDTSTSATHTLNWSGITTLTFSRISGSGSSADHDNLVYTTNLSTNDFSETKKVVLYPNPTNNEISIMGLSDSHDYKIYSILGTEVANGIVNQEDKIDVNKLPKGTYFLKIGVNEAYSFIKK